MPIGYSLILHNIYSCQEWDLFSIIWNTTPPIGMIAAMTTYQIIDYQQVKTLAQQWIYTIQTNKHS